MPSFIFVQQDGSRLKSLHHQILIPAMLPLRYGISVMANRPSSTLISQEWTCKALAKRRHGQVLRHPRSGKIPGN